MRRWILAASLALCAFAANADGLENKWRLEVSGSAKTAGQIVVQVSPEKGDPIRATTQIAAGRAENDVAADLSAALQMVASGQYSVEVVDGEVVLVKKMDGERDFAVTVVENTVQGVTVNIDTE
jgi:uncharacterized protein (DUF2141 family)